MFTSWRFWVTFVVTALTAWLFQNSIFGLNTHWHAGGPFGSLVITLAVSGLAGWLACSRLRRGNFGLLVGVVILAMVIPLLAPSAGVLRLAAPLAAAMAVGYAVVAIIASLVHAGGRPMPHRGI